MAEYLRCVRSFLCVVCVGTALSVAGTAAAAGDAAGNGSSDLGSIEFTNSGAAEAQCDRRKDVANARRTGIYGDIEIRPPNSPTSQRRTQLPRPRGAGPRRGGLTESICPRSAELALQGA